LKHIRQTFYELLKKVKKNIRKKFANLFSLLGEIFVFHIYYAAVGESGVTLDTYARVHKYLPPPPKKKGAKNNSTATKLVVRLLSFKQYAYHPSFQLILR
jgi:hypothetical protein